MADSYREGYGDGFDKGRWSGRITGLRAASRLAEKWCEHSFALLLRRKARRLERRPDVGDDSVRVATGGTVAVGVERCPECKQPMLYRVNSDGRIAQTFCGYSMCAEWMKAKPWEARRG